MGNFSGIERIMLKSFKDRLQYDALDNPVILYSSDRIYEYNYKTHKIRPFTSVVWFNLDTGDYCPFVEYFENKCENAIDSYNNSGIIDDQFISKSGYFDKEYIIINMECIDDALNYDKSYINDQSAYDFLEIKDSFKYFFNQMNILYEDNIECIKQSIERNFDKI